MKDLECWWFCWEFPHLKYFCFITSICFISSILWTSLFLNRLRAKYQSLTVQSTQCYQMSAIFKCFQCYQMSAITWFSEDSDFLFLGTVQAINSDDSKLWSSQVTEEKNSTFSNSCLVSSLSAFILICSADDIYFWSSQRIQGKKFLSDQGKFWTSREIHYWSALRYMHSWDLLVTFRCLLETFLRHSDFFLAGGWKKIGARCMLHHQELWFWSWKGKTRADKSLFLE